MPSGEYSQLSVVTVIGDGTSGHKASVTSLGQLITAPLDYDIDSSVTFDAVDTAFNMVPPLSGKRIVISGILLYANKGVGPDDATVEIYEADAVDSIVVLKHIIQTEMPRKTPRDILPLNLLTNPGVWINGKTDDISIFTTLFCYYVDA